MSRTRVPQARILYNFDRFVRSRVTEGTWCVEIWALSWVMEGSWRKVKYCQRYDNFSQNSDIPYIKGLFWVQRCTTAVDFMTNWSKQCWNIEILWWNSVPVTAPKARQQNENFVRRVMVTEGWWIDRNCTISGAMALIVVLLTNWYIIIIPSHFFILISI